MIMEFKKQDKINKLFFTLNIIVALIAVLMAITLIAWNIKGSVALEYKAGASTCFFSLAFINLIYVMITKKNKIIFPALMVSALLFDMIGDIVLQQPGNNMFMIGGTMFAIGHILATASLSFIKRVHWLDVICWIVPAVVVSILICVNPIFIWENGTQSKIFACIYTFSVCMMAGKGISNFIREQNKFNTVIFVASLLFTISDFCLLFDEVGQLNNYNLHSHIFYYPAEIIFALSIYFYERYINIK